MDDTKLIHKMSPEELEQVKIRICKLITHTADHLKVKPHQHAEDDVKRILHMVSSCVEVAARLSGITCDYVTTAYVIAVLCSIKDEEERLNAANRN